jgi:phosphoglycerate dehydrogenase-like enzyme
VLWTLDGVIITPHNSGDTAEAEAAAHALARAQMLRYRAGLPLHHVVSGSARPSR